MATIFERKAAVLREAIDTAPARIMVKNLHTTVSCLDDVWGRTGTRQPITVSAEVFLRTNFESSAGGDAVRSDTVHYGTLAKAIMAALESRDAQKAASTDAHGLCWCLISALQGGVVDIYNPAVGALRITVNLPKGTLLSDGESATHTISNPSLGGHVSTFSVQGLCVPTIIGVNPHERLAKQVVIANLKIEFLQVLFTQRPGRLLIGRELEDIAMKVIGDSDFETLEALTNYLAGHLASYLLEIFREPGLLEHCWLNIELEKPVAIPAADAACVAIKVNVTEALQNAAKRTGKGALETQSTN